MPFLCSNAFGVWLALLQYYFAVSPRTIVVGSQECQECQGRNVLTNALMRPKAARLIQIYTAQME